MPTVKEMEELFEDYEEEQRADDLEELHRVEAELYRLIDRVRLLKAERKKLRRELGLPSVEEE